MTRVIEISFTGDPQAVVDKAREAAERHGAVFAGDRFAGTFSGNGIEGHYRFGEQAVTVTIENKPEFAPWPMVESAIRGFFTLPDVPAGAASASDGRSRHLVADRIIKKYVLLSSGAGLIPLPLADLAAVTAVQVAMLQEISKLYGVEAPEPLLQNFVTGLTGGMLARIGASAVKAIPGIGTLLGGASMLVMSGASTYAVGQVAKRELESRGDLAKIDMNRAKRDYATAYESGKEVVANLKSDEGGDLISKLERLGGLRDRGVLTEAEFQAQKAKLLNER